VCKLQPTIGLRERIWVARQRLDHSPWQLDDVGPQFVKVGNVYRYPDSVLHALRHTALTWMADSGVPLYVLQRVAGHQDPAVTAHYLHPDTAALADAGSAFSAWWGLNGGQIPAADPETNRSAGGESGA
jgi:integrase